MEWYIGALFALCMLVFYDIWERHFRETHGPFW